MGPEHDSKLEEPHVWFHMRFHWRGSGFQLPLRMTFSTNIHVAANGAITDTFVEHSARLGRSEIPEARKPVKLQGTPWSDVCGLLLSRRETAFIKQV